MISISRIPFLRWCHQVIMTPLHMKLPPIGLQVTNLARPESRRYCWASFVLTIADRHQTAIQNCFREAVLLQSFQQIPCFNIHLCYCRTVWPGLSHGANNNTNFNSRQKKIQVNVPDSCGNSQHVCWNWLQEFNDIVDSSIPLYST